METIDLKFKRPPLKPGEIPAINGDDKVILPKVTEILSDEFKSNEELFYWFKSFLTVSAYSGWATDMRVTKKGNKPMVISGSSEPLGEIFQAVVTDNSFSIVTSPIKNIEELGFDKKTGLTSMLDITPNEKERPDDYDATIQYSISKRGEYSITILEEVPHTMENFPEANTFPVDGAVGSYMLDYYKKYCKTFDPAKEPVSVRASYSFTNKDNSNNPQPMKSNFDIVTLDGLFVIKVKGEEYMRTKDIKEVQSAIVNHPDIATDLRETPVAKEYLDKFLKAYEGTKKTTFVIAGMLK
ncbi:MAG: hypothetical protein E7354_04600 [Clostridiales bacterium]|nr:hypothetical protein [Clostridiales bacterium]